MPIRTFSTSDTLQFPDPSGTGANAFTAASGFSTLYDAPGANDGITIPFIDDKYRPRIANDTYTITAIKHGQHGKVHSHQDWVISLGASPNVILNAGTRIIFQGTGLDPIVTNVRSVDPNTGDITVRSPRELDLYSTVSTGVTRYGGIATFSFGSIKMTAGIPAESGIMVRWAMILTDSPASGATFAARKAAGEVIWSRVYPKTSTVIIPDWGGMQTGEGYFSPNTGEKTLMLAAYAADDAGFGTFDANVDITYNIQTTIED